MRKKILAVGLIGSMLTGLLAGCSVSGSSELLTSETTQGVADIIPVVEDPVADEDAMWTFSYNMLKENLGDTNPVLSPMSAYLAMGMVGLGAKGDTLAEFENVMGKGMQTTAGTLMQNLPNWLNDTREEKKSVLSVSNAVWVDETMHPDESWVKNVSDIYAAEAYRGVLSSEGVKRDINRWVEKKTNSLIKEFLTEPLDAEAKMALFNTIYFNGQWVNEFEKTSTYVEEFITSDGQAEKVDMMHDQRTELYLQNEKMDGVVLDYRYGNMAFVALKPTAGQTVREMYEALTYEELAGLLDNGSSELIKLKLPKFEVEFDKKLNETLQNMGIKRAFDERLADFTGLGYTDNGNSLYISLVRQKAVVKLDEEGTEAAAVTMVVMNECAMAMPEKPPIEVYFDEPFLYMIMDMESKTPLFMGVMDNPVK
jgi:serpin B